MFPPFFEAPTGCGGYEECVNFSGDWETGEGGIYTQAWYLDEAKRGKVLNADASWRKMFPMQPALRIESLRMSGGCYCGEPTVEECVLADRVEVLQNGGLEGGEGRKGATMGLLWDVLVWIFDEWPEVGFFLEWPKDTQLEGEMERDEGLNAMEEETATHEALVSDEGKGNDLVILIKHSESCYAARRGSVYEQINPWPRSGLAICEFEEDLIRVVKAS